MYLCKNCVSYMLRRSLIFRALEIATCLFIYMILPESAKAATPWLDSLYVRVADASVERNGGNAVVVFDLEVFRPVKEWNNNDTTLGSSDFVFGKAGKDMGRVFKDVQVRSLNAAIQTNSTASLKLEARFVLGKLQISLTDLENSTSRLKIPYREWVKLCRVELPLVDPATVELGLVWDPAATGMITRNIPILEVLMDDLDKIPDKILNFEDYSSSLAVCSGEEFFLFAHAVSSGNGLNCIWQYTVDRGGAYKDLSTPATDWKDAADGFQYRVTGEDSDTLWLRNLTTDFNGVAFRCVAEDLTVSTEKRETPDMTLTVWPEVQVALEGYASAADYQAGIGKSADTIRHCPGENGFARVAFYGIRNNTQMNNLKRMGNVYVVYHWVNELGSDGRDTLVVNMTNLGFQNFSWNSSFVLTAEKLQLQLPEDGKYYIHEVWTDSCRNGKVLVDYDTVFLRSNADVALEFDPIEYVAGSGDIDVASGLGIKFSSIHLKVPSIGNVLGDYYDAPAGKVGKDTLLYTYTAGSCTVTATREVDVISSKHVAIKVFLEGPYSSKADSMRCIYEEDFPALPNKYMSPYTDNKQCSKPFPKFDRKIVDWIYVEAWDYPPNGLNLDDKKKGVLVDSTSALLLSDGRIVGLDGSPYVSFDKLPANDYYIKVKHRNHLSVMSAKPVTLASGTPKEANTIDFTIKSENALDLYGDVTKPVMKNLSGRYVMFGGDLNGDGMIAASDISSVIKMLRQMGYVTEDVNFDGVVSEAEKTIVADNIGVYIKF